MRRKQQFDGGTRFAKERRMRPLRHYLPDRAYLITARCFEERFYLAPDTEAVSLIVATCLAQAVEMYQLELFAYVVMSNHLHLVVRAPKGGLPEAMQLFFSQVARRINVLRNRTGPVFSDRYHHQTICDEVALRSAIRYVLFNPQRAGIADAMGAWAGLSSIADTCDDRVLVCTRRTLGKSVVWSVVRVERHVVSRDAYPRDVEHVDGTREENFVLACQRASLTPGEEGRLAHTAFAAALRVERDALRSVPLLESRSTPCPHERPTRPKRSRAPSCIASTSQSRIRYVTERRAFVTAYRHASERFRRGQDAVFPPGCCLPWPRLYSLVGSCSDTIPAAAPPSETS